MHAKVLIVNNARNWHRIKALHEHIVSMLVIPLYYFFPERKVFSHIPTFMISPQNNDFLRIVDLNKKYSTR